MKNEVLLELARRWKEEAKTPEMMDGSPEAAEQNAKDQGMRETKRECADALHMLVELLG